MKIQTTQLLGVSLLSLIITACGGADSSPLNPPASSAGAVSSKNLSSTLSSSTFSSVDSTSPKKLGHGFGDNFIEGTIAKSTTGTLSAGGNTILTINVVSATNTLVTTPVAITFNSPCIAAGEAILTVGTEPTNKVTADNGEASIAYTANGCVGADQITASASIDGQVVNAQLVLTVDSDTVQSITFTDANPTLISLKGTGGIETSVVRFQVVGSSGAPIKNVDVDFVLSSEVGGLKLKNITEKTNKNGHASTTVQAGSIPTSVRVTATARSTNISTTSNQLIVSTGIPDQDSMSLAATDTHPVGWNIQGVESTLTIRLADAFNNPPPINTAVAFTTEGGSIASNCTTNAEGACSVKWVSQNPRPTRNSSDDSVERRLCVTPAGSVIAGQAALNACILERAGRVTVLATAIGNESFIDGDGTGYYEKGGKDIFRVAADGGNCTPNVPALSGETPAGSGTIPCDDLSEAYLDKNENGSHDDDEEFIDFTSILPQLPSNKPDGFYSAGNNIYYGVLCSASSKAAGECSAEQITIRRNLTLIMTSQYLMKRPDDLDPRNNVFPFVSTQLSLGTKPATDSTSFILADINGHGVGAGTTLSIDAANLSNASAGLSYTGPFPASDNGVRIGVTVKATSDTDLPSGSFNVVVKTPTILGDYIDSQTIWVN